MNSNKFIYEDIALKLKLGSLISKEEIQSLWSGYGQIVRLKFKKKNIIIKHIKLPKTFQHPKGWNSEFSHKRKLHSYKVEVNWYKEFCQTIDINCRMPKGLSYFQSEDEWLIIMEDLAQSGFDTIIKEAKERHLKACLRWLANFHAKYLNVKSDLIWEFGTYWHLDTRPHELEVLEDKDLKLFAKDIDTILKSCKYQTIVHGDAKLANFCFSKDGNTCAAVDFQYVGHACAMKDVILFISSAIEPKDCKSMEKWLLACYFEYLEKAIEFYAVDVDFKEVKKEWESMFCIAWADFQRFIKGWSPNHFKINIYTENLKIKALDYLKDNPL